MQFRATLSRGDTSIPVEGEVQQDSSGGWSGTFTFSKADVPHVNTGQADLAVDGDGVWSILVTSTHTIGGASRGTSDFRVLKGLP
jgi:hypothetical protein